MYEFYSLLTSVSDKSYEWNSASSTAFPGCSVALQGEAGNRPSKPLTVSRKCNNLCLKFDAHAFI